MKRNQGHQEEPFIISWIQFISSKFSRSSDGFLYELNPKAPSPPCFDVIFKCLLHSGGLTALQQYDSLHCLRDLLLTISIVVLLSRVCKLSNKSTSSSDMDYFTFLRRVDENISDPRGNSKSNQVLFCSRNFSSRFSLSDRTFAYFFVNNGIEYQES